MSQKVLLNQTEVHITLHRLACQLLENHLVELWRKEKQRHSLESVCDEAPHLMTMDFRHAIKLAPK